MRDIVIKGEHIVHGIYITVIFILAIALIFKSSDSSNLSIDNDIEEELEKEDTVQMVKNASITIIKNTQPKISPVIIPKKKDTETPTTQITQNETQEEEEEEQEEELLPITGQTGFFIDKITKEIKGEDWVKVVKIKFTIINQKPKSFYPKVLIYLWDDNDDDDVRTYIEEEIYFNKIDPGKSITQEKNVSISFNEIDKEKTLKAVLYDEDDEELNVAIEKFTVS